MSKNNVLILWLLIGVGLLAGLVSFKHRYSAEARNRRVELVIDYADAQLLANTTRRRAMDETLTQLRQAGITTVAVTEDTLGTLLGNGVLLPPQRDGDTTVLTFAPGFPGQRQRVLENLREKTSLTVTSAGPDSLRVNAPWPQFNGTPIGLDADAVKTVQRNHLLVAPRLLNFTGVTPQNIAWELAQTKAQCATPDGIGPLIFSGAAVLGNRPLIPVTARRDGPGRADLRQRGVRQDVRRRRPFAPGRRADGARPQHRQRRDGHDGRADRHRAVRARRPRAQHPRLLRPPVHQRPDGRPGRHRRPTRSSSARSWRGCTRRASPSPRR